MHRFLRSFLLLCALGHAAAQSTTESPLLHALKHVPAEALLLDSFSMVEFADIGASLGLRRVAVPDSWADMVAEHNDQVVLMSLPMGLPPALASYLVPGAPTYPEVLGFDLFDIKQTVSFGQPPYNATLLFGDFGADAIVAAFGARGYDSAHELPAGRLLCPEAGCDTGANTNLGARNLGNVFGGDLGRTFPVWLAEGAIAGSASDQLLEIVAASYAGHHTSVAELGEVRAINALLYEYPFVSSVLFVHPLALANPDLMPLLLTDTAAEGAEAALGLLDEHALPLYLMAAYAAVADETHEYGLAMIAYPSEDLAEAAASVIEQRLGVFESARTNTTYEEAFKSVGELLPPRAYWHEGTGGWLVVVGIRVPIPFELNESGRPQLAGRPYSMLVSALHNRDTTWLAPSN